MTTPPDPGTRDPGEIADGPDDPGPPDAPRVADAPGPPDAAGRQDAPGPAAVPGPPHAGGARDAAGASGDPVSLLVRFPTEQHAQLREWCAEHGFSMATVIRGLVARFLEGQLPDRS